MSSSVNLLGPMADIFSMIQAQLQSVRQTPNTPVNILFVDCDAEFVNGIAAHTRSEQLNITSVSFCEFKGLLETCPDLGAIVFDAAVVQTTAPETLYRILETLHTYHIAAFFRGFGPAIDDFPLAAILSPETEDQLPIHLAMAARYVRRRRLEQQCPIDADVTEQLELAGQVQRNFLPSHLPHTDRIRWATMFRPAQWVSGDIYDIARLDEKHIGFYLADAVGHSMPAALLTIFLKQATVMRQTFGHDYRIFEPVEVVSELNRRMAQQEFSGCLFATCCYGLLNIESYELRLARAGHPYPVLIRDGQLTCLQSRGGLLGVFGEAKFEQVTISLQPGDKLFIHSDGGERLIGTPKDDGSLSFGQAFESIAALPVEAMIQAYDHMAGTHRFAPGELDDVTALGLEILP